MKHTLIILFAMSLNTVFAQYDFTPYANADSINKQSTINITIDSHESPLFYSSGVWGDTWVKSIDYNDTLYIPVKVGDIVLDEEDTDVDTLHLSMTLGLWKSGNSITSNGAVKAENKYVSYEAESVYITKNNTATNAADFRARFTHTYPIVENTTDTIIVTVPNNNVSKIYVNNVLFYLGNSTSSLVTNTPDLLSINSSVISNPVSDGMLNIDLKGKITTLQLFSLKNELISTFEVNEKASIDVSSLSEGMYILKDTETNSYRRILIY